jgi:hypothetical protein
MKNITIATIHSKLTGFYGQSPIEVLDREIAALQKSVEKWRRLENGAESRNKCALCRIHPVMCSGCPIRIITGERYCSKTPYDAWHTYIDAHYKDACFRYDCPTCRKLAKAERLFLQKILRVMLDLKQKEQRRTGVAYD